MYCLANKRWRRKQECEFFLQKMHDAPGFQYELGPREYNEKNVET